MTLADIAGETTHLVSRFASGAAHAPAVAGFVLLGAAVLAGRSVLDAARQAASLLPSPGDKQRDGGEVEKNTVGRWPRQGAMP